MCLRRYTSIKNYCWNPKCLAYTRNNKDHAEFEIRCWQGIRDYMGHGQCPHARINVRWYVHVFTPSKILLENKLFVSPSVCLILWTANSAKLLIDRRSIEFTGISPNQFPLLIEALPRTTNLTISKRRTYMQGAEIPNSSYITRKKKKIIGIQDIDRLLYRMRTKETAEKKNLGDYIFLHRHKSVQKFRGLQCSGFQFSILILLPRFIIIGDRKIISSIPIRFYITIS